MPSPSAPSVTAASPVSTPALARSSSAPISWPRADTAATRSRAALTARSASSSVAGGVPQTAMTASPMNFSTVPPYREMSRRQVSKYLDRSSRTSSASRDSESVVNPTRSAKRTETRRRSAACFSGTAGGGVAAAGASATSSELPQSPQNRFPGGFEAPHDAQTDASAFPQSPQNRLPAGFSAPQLGQVLTVERLIAEARGAKSQRAAKPKREAGSGRRGATAPGTAAAARP